MTSDSTVVAGGAIGRPGPTLERRAAVTLRIVAAFAGFIAILMLGGVMRQPSPAALILPAVLGLVALSLAAAAWIDRGDAWAIRAAAPLMFILVMFGVLDFLASLQRSTLEIPLGAVLAVWAFRAPPARVAAAARPARTAGLVGAFVALHAVITLGPGVFGPGGPFDASRRDIDVSVTVDCGELDGGIPNQIPVTFAWSWSRAEPFPSAPDAVAVAWHGTALDAEDPFFIADVSTSDIDTIWNGGGGGESEGAARRLVNAFETGLTFGVDVPRQKFAPGSVTVMLGRQPGAYPHGELRFAGTYAHADWEARADGSCSW